LAVHDLLVNTNNRIRAAYDFWRDNTRARIKAPAVLAETPAARQKNLQK